MPDGRARHAEMPVYHWRSRLRQVVRRRRHTLLYHLTRTALVPLRAMSLPRALALADRAGDLAYAAVPSVRRLALQHLAIAFGDTLSAAAREDIARASYRSWARCFVELVKLDEIRQHFDAYVSIEGWEHLEAVHAQGRGGIAVTGHIGNYDLLAAYVCSKGYAFAASARSFKDARLDQLLTDIRTSIGVHIIPRGTRRSGTEILKVLKRGEILALHIDRDIRTPSLSVPFFGRLARTPAAAAVLAMRRDVPVVPVFAQRRPEGGHHFTVLPPICPARTGNRQRDIVELTHRLSQLLEEQIRRNPAEWNWWNRRWRRAPVPGLDLDAEPTMRPELTVQS